MVKTYEFPLIKVWDHGPEIKSFQFEKPESFQYQAGQECLVSFLDGRFPGERKPMSIASAPSQKDILELTIKRYGPFTEAFHELKPGDTVQIQGPMGKTFRFDKHQLKPIVFLGGGTGVVPFISFLREAVARNSTSPFILFQANKTTDHILYGSELEEMANVLPNLQVVHTLTRQVEPGWHGESGRIHPGMVFKYVNLAEDWSYFICGPAAMVLDLRNGLLEAGIPLERIHFDPWGIQLEKKFEKKQTN